MTYSAKHLADLRNELATVSDKHRSLMQRYVNWAFQNDDAKEYAHHGFLRRMKTLSRSVARVFELLPPELRQQPEKDDLHDAEIYAQVFVFNAFGAIDNLAWVLVKERGLKTANGKEIPERKVGLRKGNREVRDAISPPLKAYLETLDNWFAYMEDFRHALAHRVPLYIPPYCVDPANESAYNDLERRRTAALWASRLEEYERLTADQSRLTYFKPWMVHSVRRGSNPMYFHFQLLADFNTVNEIAGKTFEELDSSQAEAA